MHTSVRDANIPNNRQLRLQMQTVLKFSRSIRCLATVIIESSSMVFINGNFLVIADLSEGGGEVAFSAPSSWITEIEQTLPSPRPFFVTLKWWDPTGYQAHSA